MSELISREVALDCFRDWIDRCGNEHTADEDATYQRIAELPAVQPEPDYISRQAAIALAKDIHVPTGDGGVYRTRSIDPQEVRELPAVQPDHTADVSKKVGWIPCSERLPERSIEVLTYTALVNLIEIQTLERDEHGFMYWENQHGDRQDLTVTAWMPLPEPYKGGDSE